jgi:hypothetical protein
MGVVVVVVVVAAAAADVVICPPSVLPQLTQSVGTCMHDRTFGFHRASLPSAWVRPRSLAKKVTLRANASLGQGWDGI